MIMNRKPLFLVCFIFIFLACQLKVAMAMIPTEKMNSDSPLLNVTHLPDGTIERHYANRTVMHDYSVNLQVHVVETMTMAVTTSTISPPLQLPDTPDDSNNPLDYTPLVCSFLVLIGAGTILRTWAKHKSLWRLPTPLENPSTRMR